MSRLMPRSSVFAADEDIFPDGVVSTERISQLATRGANRVVAKVAALTKQLDVWLVWQR